MPDATPYGLLATAVLVLHATIVLFVIGGLVVVVPGNVLSWRWVNARWFRLLHLATILFVVAESWLGVTCPLTTLERWLRTRAGTGFHAGGFIEHWVRSALFWDLPPWVFVAAYSAFGLAVAAAWWRFPPEKER